MPHTSRFDEETIRIALNTLQDDGVVRSNPDYYYSSNGINFSYNGELLSPESIQRVVDYLRNHPSVYDRIYATPSPLQSGWIMNYSPPTTLYGFEEKKEPVKVDKLEEDRIDGVNIIDYDISIKIEEQ